MIAKLREAARRILRRPPSDWAGPDHARAAITGGVPIDTDNRFDVVCFPAGRTEESAALQKLVANGHRVLRPDPEGLAFDSLDAVRRERGFGATVSIVLDPAWRELARRPFSGEAGWQPSQLTPGGSRVVVRADRTDSLLN